MNYLYSVYRMIVVFGFIFYTVLFSKKSPQELYEGLRQVAFPFGQFLVENKERFDMIKRENENGKGCVIMANHHGVYDVCMIQKFIECYLVVKSDVCGELVNEEKGDILQKFLRKQYFDKYLLIPYKRGDKESGNEVKRIIARETSKGKNVIIFPEGTSQRCFHKPLPFRKGIFDLCFEKQIPIFSVSINYSKDIGFHKTDKTDFMKLCTLSPHVKIFCNGIFYPTSYYNSTQLMNEVYESISDHVYLEWKKEWEI